MDTKKEFYREKVSGSPDKLITTAGQVLTPEQFGTGTGFKEVKQPAIATNPTSPMSPASPMITGYDQTGKAVQVPKGAHVPGISLTPKTINAGKVDQLKQSADLNKLKSQNEQLLSQQPTPVVQVPTASEKIQSLLGNLGSNIQDLKSKTSLEQDITGKAKTANDLSLAVNDARTNLANLGVIQEKDLLALEGQGRGISSGLISAQQTNMTRDQKLDSMIAQNNYNNLLVQQSIANNNLTNAQAIVKDTADSYLQNAQFQLQALQEQGKIDNEEKTRLLTQATFERDIALKGYVPLIQDQASKFKPEELFTDPITGKIYKKPSADEATISKLQEKYPDAGIMNTDSVQTASEKLKNSKIYQKETDTGKTTYGKLGVDANGNDIYGFIDTGREVVKPTTEEAGSQQPIGKTVTTQSGDSYDLSTYAEDPNHAIGVQNAINDAGTFTSPNDIQNYIDTVDGSPLTPEIIMTAAYGNGISPEVLSGLLKQESGLATSNVSKNNNNPGGVTWSKPYQDAHPGTSKGTSRREKEGGNYVKFESLQDGVNAVAEQLARRKVDSSTVTDVSKGIYNGFNTADASIPKEDTAHTPVPQLDGRTPYSIFQNAIAYALQGGTLQSFVGGLSSKSPKTQAIKNAIDNKASALASAAGTNVSQLRSDYKNMSATQKKQVDFVNQVTRALNGAEQGASLTQELFKNKGLNPYDSTFVNAKLNTITKLLGDSGDIRAYQSAMTEIGNEYAQVFSRGGQRSVEGNKLAQELINGDVKLSDMQQTFDTLQQIGGTVVSTATDQMNNLAIPQTLINFNKITSSNNNVGSQKESPSTPKGKYIVGTVLESDGKNYKIINDNGDVEEIK